MDSLFKTLGNDLKVLRDHRWYSMPCMQILSYALNGVPSSFNQPEIRPNMEYFGHYTFHFD
ncbi:DEHA2C00902p [Debaryomyces hansenii CBS767]|uniref:DEHA2C00902p n=1 Tax=Debaryomyces hansenii (strain ATCC 36239 / CBS 767 / BCRC 21394 / JCM 1990 / NBRC 0083 / IGC 2968) TaxID=284592 RepID=B5RT55_DEBHA|nr:DEHA2C00902p [Debaryomyces hansenii CBS767]CAR65517.1 DEHA2C00902p [Debaryomyces hansenii CBS767]|eukprot:XP_002770150.1 DEHA2C00902p [Debaryomyces hansenii CBS767]